MLRGMVIMMLLNQSMAILSGRIDPESCTGLRMDLFFRRFAAELCPGLCTKCISRVPGSMKGYDKSTLQQNTRSILRVARSTGIISSAERFPYSNTPTRSINLTVLCPGLAISCPLQLMLFHAMFQCHLAGRAVGGEGPRREEPTLQRVSKINKFGCCET